MNENIKGGFIRLLPVEGDIASLRAGDTWVRASAISRVQILGAAAYEVQVGVSSYRCSNDPFPLMAEMAGETF